MALNIKNPDVERLVSEIAAVTGENKTEVIKMALQERQQRLLFQVAPYSRAEEIKKFLEREIWPAIPRELLGRRMTRREKEEILGYGSEGV